MAERQIFHIRAIDLRERGVEIALLVAEVNGPVGGVLLSGGTVGTGEGGGEGLARIYGSTPEDYIAKMQSIADDLSDIVEEDRQRVAEP